MSFYVLSINAGKSRKVKLDSGRFMISAINKKPLTGVIYIAEDGIVGDESADTKLHGGRDKAVCAYSFEHYIFWEKFLLKPLSSGAFGENLTLSEFYENNVFLGDIYKIGMAELQVSQPRVPCQKINKNFGRNDIVRKIRATGKSGFYFRVLKPGNVVPGDSVVLLDRPEDPISIQEANRLWQRKEVPQGFVESILAKDFVSSTWKKDLKNL